MRKNPKNKGDSGFLSFSMNNAGLGCSYSASIGIVRAYKNYKTDTNYINTSTFWFYNYSFSGTWPNITLTLDGQIATYFGETALNPTTRVFCAAVGVFQEGETKDVYKMTNWTREKDFLFRSSAYSDSEGNDSFGYWWVLTPFKGEASNTFELDTSDSDQRKPEFAGKIVAALQSHPSLSAELSGSLTNYAETESSVTFPYPRPSMTVSLSSVTTELAVMNITNHTNPLSYWRYKAQWKLSTASSWSTSSTAFTVTSSTGSRQLTTTSLTQGATYNYRIAYVDQNDNIVGNSNSISFTIPVDQATVYVNSGGTVKKAKVWYNNGGTIKKVKKIYYNNSGTIKNVKKV